MPQCLRFPAPLTILAIAIAAAIPANAARGESRLVSVDEAVRLGLASPSMLAVREAIAQARADVRAASAVPNPSLSVEGGMLPLNRRFSVDEPGGPPEFAAGLSFPIDWLVFGKRCAAMAGAEVGVEAARAQVEDAERLRVLEIEHAFYTVIEAKALLEVARQSRSDIEAADSAVRKAAEHGGRPQIESMRARLELQAARREERAAQSALFSAQAALQALAGAPVDAAGELDEPADSPFPSVEDACKTAVERRPDLRALRLALEQAKRGRTLESRNALPEMALGVNVGHQFQRAIGSPDATGWGVSLEFSLPLFDRNQGGRARAESVVTQAERELEAALATLRSEVEQELNALGTTRSNAAEAARSDLEIASQVHDSVRKAYEAGGRTFLELIDAQRSFREASRAHVTSRADYWRALSRFNAVLGRRNAL